MPTSCSIIVLSLLLLRHRVNLIEVKLIFDGTIVDSPPDLILSISCSTPTKSFECTMEFMHNNATIESIRYSDSGCYNSHGRCKKEICACSKDCKSYHWNLTTPSVQTNDSFGCQMRFQNSTTKSLFKVYTFVIYNGTDFTLSTSVINPVNTVTTQLRPTEGLNGVAVLGIILGTGFGIGLIIFCCVLLFRKLIKEEKGNTREMSDVTTKIGKNKLV